MATSKGGEGLVADEDYQQVAAFYCVTHGIMATITTCMVRKCKTIPVYIKTAERDEKLTEMAKEAS